MNNKVFTYWENPKGEVTPTYIELCLDSMKRWCPELIILTPENVDEYLTDSGLDKRWKNLTCLAHRKDCICVSIINKFGGTWLDADTVFIRPISLLADYVNDEKEFSFFQWSDGRVLNGYFHAKERSLVTESWLKSINTILSSNSQLQWTTFGEPILTPLALWKFKDVCQKLPRAVFLPINIDRIPYVFFEDIDYRPFIKQETIAVGLNHSFFMAHFPQLKTKMKSELLEGNILLHQVFRDAIYGYGITPYDDFVQYMSQTYSYGSLSSGDIHVLITLLSGKEKVVELGTNQGTTARMLSRYCKEVITIDVFEQLELIEDKPWQEEYIKNYNDNPHSFTKIKNYLSDCKNVTVLRGRSYDVAEQISDDSIDGCFFDADHSYDGVSKDYKAWINKIRVGGTLVFHDFTHSRAGVNKFYYDTLIKDDRLQEITYHPTTFYTSIVAFRRVK